MMFIQVLPSCNIMLTIVQYHNQEHGIDSIHQSYSDFISLMGIYFKVIGSSLPGNHQYDLHPSTSVMSRKQVIFTQFEVSEIYTLLSQ